jgi:hypothetical protein
MGHTVRWTGSYEVTPPWLVVGGWGRQVNMKTASGDASAGSLGQTPPGSSCSAWQVFERLAGDVAFQTAHDLCG